MCGLTTGVRINKFLLAIPNGFGVRDKNVNLAMTSSNPEDVFIPKYLDVRTFPAVLSRNIYKLGVYD